MTVLDVQVLKLVVGCPRGQGEERLLLPESAPLQVNADAGEFFARSFRQHSFMELSRPQNSTDHEAATDESDPAEPGQKFFAVHRLLGVGRLVGAQGREQAKRPRGRFESRCAGGRAAGGERSATATRTRGVGERRRGRGRSTKYFHTSRAHTRST